MSYKTFKKAYDKGNYLICKEIFNESKNFIDFTINNNEILKDCCDKENIDFINWLNGLYMSKLSLTYIDMFYWFIKYDYYNILIKTDIFSDFKKNPSKHIQFGGFVDFYRAILKFDNDIIIRDMISIIFDNYKWRNSVYKNIAQLWLRIIGENNKKYLTPNLILLLKRDAYKYFDKEYVDNIIKSGDKICGMILRKRKQIEYNYKIKICNSKVYLQLNYNPFGVNFDEMINDCKNMYGYLDIYYIICRLIEEDYDIIVIKWLTTIIDICNLSFIRTNGIYYNKSNVKSLMCIIFKSKKIGGSYCNTDLCFNDNTIRHPTLSKNSIYSYSREAREKRFSRVIRLSIDNNFKKMIDFMISSVKNISTPLNFLTVRKYYNFNFVLRIMAKKDNCDYFSSFISQVIKYDTLNEGYFVIIAQSPYYKKYLTILSEMKCDIFKYHALVHPELTHNIDNFIIDLFMNKISNEEFSKALIKILTINPHLVKNIYLINKLNKRSLKNIGKYKGIKYSVIRDQAEHCRASAKKICDWCYKMYFRPNGYFYNKVKNMLFT